MEDILKNIINNNYSSYSITHYPDRIKFECDIPYNKSKAHFWGEKIYLPTRYIINKNATILFWENGTKTIVKRCEGDEFNARLGFLTAFFQHYSGMSKNKPNKYLSKLQVEEDIKDKEKKKNG